MTGQLKTWSARALVGALVPIALLSAYMVISGDNLILRLASQRHASVVECAIHDLSQRLQCTSAEIRRDYQVALEKDRGRNVVTLTHRSDPDAEEQTFVKYYFLIEGERCRYLGLVAGG